MRTAAVLRSYGTFQDAVTEAARLTNVFRTKFKRPEEPPYRVRFGRRRGHWSSLDGGNWVPTDRRARWHVLTPRGDIELIKDPR